MPELKDGCSREDIFSANADELLEAILTDDGIGIENKRVVLYRLLMNHCKILDVLDKKYGRMF